jgi:hypothetical protein
MIAVSEEVRGVHFATTQGRDRAEAFIQFPRLIAECPDVLRFGLLDFNLHDQTPLEVMHDTIQTLQRTYVKHPELLQDLVPSDMDSEILVAIRCPDEDPTSLNDLQALLFVEMDEERKLSCLGAVVARSRYVDGQQRIVDPFLWEEDLDLEAGGSLRESKTTNETDSAPSVVNGGLHAVPQ